MNWDLIGIDRDIFNSQVLRRFMFMHNDMYVNAVLWDERAAMYKKNVE